MNFMSDKVFIDTNILVYTSMQDDPAKHEQSISKMDR
jgi:predicted nucleic acid-binding protein